MIKNAVFSPQGRALRRGGSVSAGRLLGPLGAPGRQRGGDAASGGRGNMFWARRYDRGGGRRHWFMFGLVLLGFLRIIIVTRRKRAFLLPVVGSQKSPPGEGGKKARY